MRVQFISTHFSPESTGNAPYVRGCAEGLAARGHEVSVVAGAPHYPGWEVHPESTWRAVASEGGVLVSRHRAYVPRSPTFLKRLLYEFAHGLAFARHIDREADVVVLVSPSLFASLVVRIRMSMSRGRPAAVLWMQDLYSAGVAETPGTVAKAMTRLMATIESSLARSCDGVVVIHDRFERFVVDRLRVAKGLVNVVRNWTHVRHGSRLSVQDVRERYGWQDESELIVLHAGNMGAKQGLENVVDAAWWASRHSRPVRFAFLGDGNQRARLEHRGRGCPAVQFIAPVPDEDFFAVLSAADVLLVNERPSLVDAAVPSKLTSYFMTGLPVVAATDPSSATTDEMVASGAGATVRPGSPEALVTAVEDTHAAWTPEKAEAGPTFVAQNLSVQRNIDLFEAALYEADRRRGREARNRPDARATNEEAEHCG